MHIGIDARFYGAIGKGLGRYTQKLIENLEHISVTGEDQYFIFLRRENFDEYQPKKANFHKVLADYRWYTVSEQLNMPRILNKYKLDLVHFPHFNVPLFYRKKFIITIHDLILLHFPTLRGTTLFPLFYWLKFNAYKIIIKSAIRRAKKIVAVSNFTKVDILKNYKISPDKIKVTYEACEDFCLIPKQKYEEVLKKYGLWDENRGIIKKYILYVGNAYPHKNLEALVLAFNEIRKRDLYLVLVGREDYFYRNLKKIVREKISAQGGPFSSWKNIIFTDFIPDEELDIIYHLAHFYIFPSLYEGFGLPPLEAMAKGVPVASSDHPCLKEILGESVYYFDAKNSKEISQTMEKMIEDEKLRKNLTQLGYQQIRKYSWEKMARETLELYKK